MSAHTITRRTFAATSLVAGFTLAAGPLRAGAIVTDAEGIVAGEVKVPVSDGTIPGYRARPATGAHWPVVLVTQEIFGIHEHIRDICRRFLRYGHGGFKEWRRSHARVTKLSMTRFDPALSKSINSLLPSTATIRP